MESNGTSLPDNLAACHELLRQQQQMQQQLHHTAEEQAETIQQQHQQIEKLRHELELFKRYLFGQRRERFVEDPCKAGCSSWKTMQDRKIHRLPRRSRTNQQHIVAGGTVVVDYRTRCPVGESSTS